MSVPVVGSVAMAAPRRDNCVISGWSKFFGCHVEYKGKRACCKQIK